MANRDLTTGRTVTQNVVENKNQILKAGAQIAETVIRQGEEAKLAEGLSVAQLELSALDNQYKIDFQGDPTNKEGVAKYKADRQSIYDNLQKNVSPLYRNQWQANTRKLTERNDATMQMWGLKQTRVNTVASVNNMMKNGLTQANADGIAVGNGTLPIEEALVNFVNSKENISGYADGNLGETTGAAIIEGNDENYIKTFVSGISETNPSEALRVLDDDIVKSSFRDQSQWRKMKDAVTVRAGKFEQAQIQLRTATTLGGENELAAGIGKTGYAELQQTYDKLDVSAPVRAFYDEVNGYGKQKSALSAEQKTNLKNKFNIFFSEIVSKDELTNGDMRAMQDSVYTGMRKQALSKNEGFGVLNQIMEPIIEEQKARAGAFQTGRYNPFQENLGLDTLRSEIDRISGTSEIEEDKIKPEQEFIRARNSNIMYDYYLDSLNKEAKSRDTTIAGLSKLPFSEEKSVYNKALASAKDGLVRTNFPSLSNLEKLPSSIITNDGETIQTGVVSDGSTASVDAGFVERKGADGRVYKVFPDGTYEVSK